MLTDAAALAIALAAIRIAQRPADACRTFGYYRFEILAAALNAALLFIIALYILFEAYKRLRSPPRGSIAADAALRNDRPGSELRGDACAKRCRCESHICAHLARIRACCRYARDSESGCWHRVRVRFQAPHVCRSYREGSTLARSHAGRENQISPTVLTLVPA